MTDEGGKARGGRPRASESSSKVLTWLPDRHYDLLLRIARADGVSVSRLLRESIAVALRDRVRRP